MTHTPGPWFVADWSYDFGDDKFTIETRSPEVLRPGQSSVWPDGIAKRKVGSTEEGSFDRETNIANARLIAAAPELLEACKRLEAEFGLALSKKTMESLHFARAAIAKATADAS